VDFDSAGRTSGIRVYPRLGVVVFETTLTAASTGAGPFPVLRQLPRLPYSLSYRDTPFSPYQLNTLAEAPDSPWLFFDDADNAFLLSPASNFPIARLHAGPDGALSSVLDVDLATLASPVPQRTMLVIGSGVNHLFDVLFVCVSCL
jgi:hypothetical protein